jgi:carbonic anhydrase
MTTSIDISRRNVKGKCDLKCAYTFKYPASNSSLTNKGIYLSLSYDGTTMSPVTYNATPYTVSQIHLYAPSLHLFNGEKAAAELVILHAPQTGGDNLYVAIPITQKGPQTQATSIIQEIIEKAATSAPAEGDTVSLNISNFTLNDIVPSRRPFMSYTGNNVNNDTMSPWIVFGGDSAIAVTSADIEKLGHIITPFDYGLTGEMLFLNQSGANSLSEDQTGEVYISCEPTNASDETVEMKSSSTAPTQFNWSDAFKNPIWKTVGQLVVAALLLFGIFWGVNRAWSSVKSGGSGASGVGNMGSAGETLKTIMGGGGATANETKHVRFAYPIARSKRARASSFA